MSDTVDKRWGVYDPVNKIGDPRLRQVKEKATPHQKAQIGADVRPEPEPVIDPDAPLPEGLRRKPTEPLNKHTGRRSKL
jgi:hypothetical protein